jgi:hypothetical protein
LVTEPGRFRIRFGLFRVLLTLLGTGPRFSYVEVSEDTIRVAMGWAFRALIPRSSVRRISKDRNMWRGIGVHGWRGEWLVNGSVSGIVTLEIDPPARALVIGVPVRLRELHVSLEDPDGFLAALGQSGRVS